jgi:cell wall-associated NlpC family hydrolase
LQGALKILLSTKHQSFLSGLESNLISFISFQTTLIYFLNLIVSRLVTFFTQEIHSKRARGFAMVCLKMLKRLIIAALVCSSLAVAKTYTVQSGDTLYRIAQKNGISTTQMLRLNPGIGGLKIGQQINLGSGTKSNPSLKRSSSTVVRVAFSKVGASYRWGSTGPYNFDCSGFTRYVMKQMGVTLPHSSRAQFNGGRVVSRNGLLPGDLVFFQGFSGRGGVGHVAVYIGNNRIIHASTPSTGVIVSSLAERYYSSRYLGARRYL